MSEPVVFLLVWAAVLQIMVIVFAWQIRRLQSSAATSHEKAEWHNQLIARNHYAISQMPGGKEALDAVSKLIWPPKQPTESGQ